jgi:Carboxypeptidase regulatory-like domain
VLKRKSSGSLCRLVAVSGSHRRVGTLFAAVWLVASVATAQTRPSIAGRVVDATGLALVGASVTLHRPSAGVERTTTTNSEGRYEFLDVPDGSYVISAALAGFSVTERDVSVWREPVTVDLALQPGSFAEEVSVIGGRLVESEEMLRRIPGSVDVLTSDVLEASRFHNQRSDAQGPWRLRA